MKIADTNQIAISVSDQGIGIAKEDHERIFNPFFQVDNELSRSYEGSGIGLSLARELVELHGGTIEVQSELGQGTTMNVLLPIHTLRDKNRQSVKKTVQTKLPLQSNNENHYKLLVAEDNLTTIDLMQTFLHSEGYQLTIATDGLEAIEIVKNTTPDVILLDLHLSKMDGFTVIKKIRKMSNHLNTPILVISAVAFEEEIERCLNLGANAFLQKPFSLTNLIEHIQKLID